MKNSILLICIIFLFYNCTKKNATSVTIEIENMKNDTAMIMLIPFGEKLSNKFETVNIKDGKFKFDTLINKPHLGIIVPNDYYKKLPNGDKYPIPSKGINFFLYPNDKIRIKGEMKEYRTEFTVEGNILNKQFSQYWLSTLDDFENQCKFMFQGDSISILNPNDSSLIHIDRKINDAIKVKNENIITFIKENPDFEISAFLLFDRNEEVVREYYKDLSENVRLSNYGKLLQNKINTWNQIKIGSKAPEFELLSINNNKIRLQEILEKRKFVVLDFWGSWCAPCMMEMPKMKEFQNQHKEQIELIGIACRDTEDNWIEAIKKHDLNWTQLFNGNENQDISVKYGIKGYPTKVIINPNGTIEGIYLGVNDDFFIKMSELLNKEKTTANKL